MSWFEGFITYSVCWWLVLFMLLPIGAQAPVQPEAGHSVGAPAKPNLRIKLLLATVLAIIPVLLIRWVIISGIIQVRGM